MRVALVQMEIAQGDIDCNLAKIERFAGLARGRGADVVVFPEYALSGSVRKRPDLIDGKGKYRRVFSALAQANFIDIVSGSFVEKIGGRPYNTSCYFDRSGKLLSAYRKTNLWHSERGRLSPGRGPAVFETRFGKAAMAICWDLSSPGIFRSMARNGARIAYVPSFWSDAGISNRRIESRNIDSLCHVRAFENELALAFCNAAGVYGKGDSLVGRSQLTLPIAGAVKRAGDARECMLVADVPAGVLERAARLYKIRSDIMGGHD